MSPAESSGTSIIDGLRADGLAIKNSVLGRMMGAEPDKHVCNLKERVKFFLCELIENTTDKNQFIVSLRN